MAYTSFDLSMPSYKIMNECAWVSVRANVYMSYMCSDSFNGSASSNPIKHIEGFFSEQQKLLPLY